MGIRVRSRLSDVGRFPPSGVARVFTAKWLEIVDQVPGGVGAEVDASVARVREAPTGAALVEQHDAAL